MKLMGNPVSMMITTGLSTVHRGFLFFRFFRLGFEKPLLQLHGVLFLLAVHRVRMLLMQRDGLETSTTW